MAHGNTKSTVCIMGVIGIVISVYYQSPGGVSGVILGMIIFCIFGGFDSSFEEEKEESRRGEKNASIKYRSKPRSYSFWVPFMKKEASRKFQYIFDREARINCLAQYIFCEDQRLAPPLTTNRAQAREHAERYYNKKYANSRL
ncbi:MAG: hypothetical protein ACTSRK_01625 [Promethearchaeota archaeon]